MQESRKQKEMFVKIPDNFTEQGLTLEQAYILGRVARFNDVGSPYYESNKTISNVMGKSESTVKRYIDELVKKGHLYRKTRTRKRLLSIKPFNYEGQNEPYKGYEVQNEPLVEVQNEPYESNKGIGESSMRFKMNSNIGQNEPHEGFKMNHYKEDNKEEYKEEKNQNPKTKNKNKSLNDLTPEEKEESFKNESLSNEPIILSEEQKKTLEELERMIRGY